MFKLNLAIWPQKPPKLLLLTEASVITESSVKTEDREFSAEGFRPKLLPKITAEASAEVNFVLTLGMVCELMGNDAVHYIWMGDLDNLWLSWIPGIIKLEISFRSPNTSHTGSD